MTQKTIDSPCTGECVIEEESGLCQGCLRTISEIIGWPNCSSQERDAVYRRIEERKKDASGQSTET